jgi:hypothetical protein
MSVAPESGRNRIMIYGPKNDGTYIEEFMTAEACSCLTFREEYLLRHGCSL